MIESKNSLLEKGVCRSCGCVWNNACWDPELGTCWWVDDSETLCSHCDETEYEPYSEED